MTEFESTSHHATVDDGLLTVMGGPPIIQQMTWGPGGEVKVKLLTLDNTEGAERELLIAKSRAPTFVATWAGNRRWNVDADCGAKRFHGTKTDGELTKALKNCGFGLEQIKLMLRECKKRGKQDYVPMYG